MDRLITLGLSDLHIGQAACPISDNFFALLAQYRHQVDTFIIAGDLFDVWIGNDVVTDFQWSVADAICQLDPQQAFFIPGNRDFLISQKFARRAGFTVVEQLDHQGRLWTHGDEYCLDDQPYQDWRRLCRSPEFKADFLSKPAEQRQAMANQARETSQRQGAHTESAIADIAVRALPPCNTVHGHTHRPAIHRQDSTRVVLGDWRPDAWVWIEDDQGAALAHWNHGWDQRLAV